MHLPKILETRCLQDTKNEWSRSVLHCYPARNEILFTAWRRCYPNYLKKQSHRIVAPQAQLLVVPKAQLLVALGQDFHYIHDAKINFPFLLQAVKSTPGCN